MDKIFNSLNEIASGFAQWRFWGYWGWQDIRQRYRRSVIGPFWVTISMAIFIGVLGFVYSRLFKLNLREYLPFLASGYLVWFFIASILNEGCATFIEAGPYLKDIKLPLTLFSAKAIWRNFIVLLHNSVVFLLVALVFRLNPGLNLFWILPATLLVMINGLWVSMFLGLAGARFRDFAPMIQSMVLILFFVSPITWMPGFIGDNAIIVKYNLVTYMLDLMRSPLLGKAPQLLSWEVGILTALIGWSITIIIFSRCYKRVVFWL